MRIFMPAILALGVLLLPARSAAQSKSTHDDSAAVITRGTTADDGEFAAFPPVSSGVRPPKAVSAPDPKYPELPEGAEERGTVVMLIGVNTKGHVEAVRVLRSDEPAFEKAAVATVKRWKFKPAQKNGHPVPVQVTVEMKFQK